MQSLIQNPSVDFSQSYLTKQIIAYIGNKRKLLPLIFKALLLSGKPLKEGCTFLDLFAGSGVVSRLAKTLHFEVFSNDWEYYSYIINKAYVETNASDIPHLFGSAQEYATLLETLNNLPEPQKDKQYIAAYYAPHSDDENEINYKIERLFYTHANALAIDKIRNDIEVRFGGGREEIAAKNERIRTLLTAQLLYEAATHTNTSGVFKAYHKGFGGHGKDARQRILAPIQLHEPVLIDSPYPAHIFQEDATSLIKRVTNLDFAYLDPPYNQHQYGSNYHLLNTIAKWDGIPAPLELNKKGELAEKAAIRHDWVETRSAYCYKQSAKDAFAQMIDSLDAEHILLSYSTDGIIPFEDMQDLCSRKGRLSLVTNEYTTYRGGKQSNGRRSANIEFIICIDAGRTHTQRSTEQVNAVLARKKLLLLFRQKFSKAKLLEQPIEFTPSGLCVRVQDYEVGISSKNYFELEPPSNSEELPLSVLERVHEILSPCTLNTKEAELAELCSRISAVAAETACKDDFAVYTESSDVRHLLALLPPTLAKLAQKKNRILFYEWLSRIRALKISCGKQYYLIEEKIEKLASLAEIRFLG